MRLYEPNRFPQGFIGPAELLWHRPAKPAETNAIKLWIRVHPSFFEEAWSIIQTLSSDRCQLRDLRFDLESFDITGPLSGVAILRALSISASEPEESRRLVVKTLACDPAEIPDSLIASFNAVDPRLA